MGKVMATFSLKNHHHPPDALSLILVTSKLNLDGPPLWPSLYIVGFHPDPLGERLVGRDPQHHTNPAPAVDQVRHQVPGGELSHGPYLQGACSGRSQQWELPRLLPFCQHPGYTSCGAQIPNLMDLCTRLPYSPSLSNLQPHWPL